MRSGCPKSARDYRLHAKASDFSCGAMNLRHRQCPLVHALVISLRIIKELWLLLLVSLLLLASLYHGPQFFNRAFLGFGFKAPQVLSSAALGVWTAFASNVLYSQCLADDLNNTWRLIQSTFMIIQRGGRSCHQNPNEGLLVMILAMRVLEPVVKKKSSTSSSVSQEDTFVEFAGSNYHLRDMDCAIKKTLSRLTLPDH